MNHSGVTSTEQRHDHQSPRLGAIGAFVARHEISAFFSLAIGLTWAVWVPMAVTGTDMWDAIWLFILAPFGLPVAGATVTWLTGGSVRHWLKGALRWRVPGRWYVAGIGVPVALTVATAVVYTMLGNTIDWTIFVRGLPAYLLNLVLVFFVLGGQEELGWRGFALPTLVERVSPVVASVVIGAVWAVWHLPLFVISGTGYAESFVAYLAPTFAVSIVYTWLYLNTGRSVVLAMILHASWNATTLFDPTKYAVEGLSQAAIDSRAWVFTAVVWAFAIGLLLVYGRDLQSTARTPRQDAESDSSPVA